LAVQVKTEVSYVVAEESQWGWLPGLAALSGCALVLSAFAFTASRSSQDWATSLFWISLLLMYAPTALRLSSPAITRRERIGLIVIVGLALYGVKVLHSPVHFTFHDEFLHWRTAADILFSGQLFSENTILTVSPLYPGLEIVTTAFASLSGLEIFPSALITLGLARVIFMVALYLFFEQVARSPQVASIAALLYMGNSNFLYFDSQFSYETLSLPIATVVLYAVVLRERSQDRSLFRLALLILPLILITTVTHHLTAYVLAGLLYMWAFVAYFVNRARREWLDVGIITVLTVVIILGWTLLTGSTTETYLGPVFSGGISEFVRLIFSDDSGRLLFRSATGQTAQTWESTVGILAVIFILAVLPFGFVEIWRTPFSTRFRTHGVKILTATALQAWNRYRQNSIAFTLSILVFLQPIMQGFRLTSAGWEIANRSSEFLFWATGFIAAIGFISLRPWRISPRIWGIVLVVWASVIFVGGSIAGWPPWARLPGPYLVSADTRSIEAQGIHAAQWAGEHFDSGDRIAADRINTLLLATYGHLRPVTHQFDRFYISPVFTSLVLGAAEQGLIERLNLRYLLVDDRLTTELPRVGVYFEAGEPGARQYTTPIFPAALAKFDRNENISRLFDSGNIRIYDVGAFDALP
jgi:hypothetical protein